MMPDGMTDETMERLKRIVEEEARKRDKDAIEKETRRKMQALDREYRHEVKEWLMLGWGYKPRLHALKNAVAHKRATCWHRIRANPKLR